MESENTLTVGDYIASIKRRRLLISWVAAPIIIAGGVVAMALPSVYQSTASFRFVTDRIQAAAAEGQPSSDEYVFALVEKLFAGEKITAIIEDVRPYPDLADKPSGAIGRLRSSVNVRMITRTVLEPTGGRERIVNTGFTLSYENRSPEVARQVADGLTNAFIELGRTDRLAVASNKAKFFNGESERIADEISKFERDLADFKLANFDRLPESSQAKLTTRGRLEQEISSIDYEIRSLEQNRIFVEQQLRQAQVGPAMGNLQQLEQEYARRSAVYADTHPDLVALRHQIDSLRRGGTVAAGNSLQAQIASEKAVLDEARQRYSEEHPDIRRIERNIAAMEERLAAGESGSEGSAGDTLMSVQLRTQLNAINTRISGLREQRTTVRVKLSELEAQLGATPEVERKYEAIARGLGSAREQYNQMVERRLEAEADVAAISSGSADRFILFMPPNTPLSPSGPPRRGILMVSLMLGLMLAFSALVSAEVFDSSVRGARDIRSLMGITPLAVVPEIRNSVFLRRRLKRLATLAGSLAVGAPVLFLAIRALSS